jgi:hypothetical protein
MPYSFALPGGWSSRRHAKPSQSYDLGGCGYRQAQRNCRQCGEDSADGAFADPMAEAEQFTPDPPMPPSGFSLANRITRARSSSGWTSVCVWVSPVLADRPAVPGQQRAQCHDPMKAKPCGQQSRQCRQAAPGQPSPVVAERPATRDGDLMPQHQDLHLPWSVTPREKRQPAEQPDCQQIKRRRNTRAKD